MENYHSAIDDLKEKLDKAKYFKIKNEARLEQLNRQKKDIFEELNGLGIKPGKLEAEIEKLKKEIEGLIKEAKEIVPSDYMKSIDT